MAKFDMTSLLNDTSKDKRPVNGFKIQYININNIIPDGRNFYSMEDIEDLKASILMFGLQQNLVVREKVGTDKYIVISGHRRRRALIGLIAEGHTQFEMVPCKVESNIDEIKTELKLIFGNSTTRELSDYEKMQQAVRLKELLTELKKSGAKLPGRMRELVADTLKVSSAQVERLETIDKKLVPELKEEFKNNNLNFSTATSLSRLPSGEQRKAFKEISEGAVPTNLNNLETKINKAVQLLEANGYEVKKKGGTPQ